MIEHDVGKRVKFLSTQIENIKGITRKIESLDDHISVLRATKKVIFSLKEKKAREPKTQLPDGGLARVIELGQR